MTYGFIFSLFFLSSTSWAQLDPKSLKDITPILGTLTGDQSQLAAFELPAGKDCKDGSADPKGSVEINNALLGQVTATGGITPIPGTDKSRAKGVVTVVNAPATIEQVTELQKGHEPKIEHDIQYTVIDPSAETTTSFRIKGAGVGFRSNLQDNGNNRITFTADVRANKGGQIRAGIRIVR